LSVASEIPSPHLDSKRGEDITEITVGFKIQALANTCYTTCIFNVLKNLASSHDSPAIGLPEHQVNKLCSYKENFGPKLAIVVPKLNRELRQLGYAVRERSPTTYDAMLKVLEDQESSYPVIGLCYQYLLDHNAAEPLDIPSPPDHTVIVLSSSSTETVIFDTFDARIRNAQGNPDRIGRGIYVIPTTKLMEYWEKASFTSWMFWVRKESKERIRTLRLEKYGLGAKEAGS